MNDLRRLTLPLIVLAGLAGCLADNTPALLDASSLLASPADLAPTPETPVGLRAIPVTGTYADYGYGAGWPTCDVPPDCTVHLPFGIHFTGTFEGDAIGIAHANLTEPGSPAHFGSFYKDPVLFTGTVADCGSGSINFFITGYGAIDTGGFRVNETLAYTPGSATSGLSSFVDAFLSFDEDPYAWPGTVELTGTVWCR